LAQQSEAVASNGLLTDIQVMDIDNPQKDRREQRSHDINNFFEEPLIRDTDGKKYRKCKRCPYISNQAVVNIIMNH
jgi:hypothetical protein